MSRLAFLLLVLAWPFRRVFGAQDRNRLVGPKVYPSWSTIQPAMGPNEEPVRYVIKTEYSAVVMQPSGDVEVQTLGSTEVDLLKGTKGVFIGTTFYPDRLTAQLLDMIAMRAWREDNPTAPEDDERTRLLRP